MHAGRSGVHRQAAGVEQIHAGGRTGTRGGGHGQLAEVEQGFAGGQDWNHEVDHHDTSCISCYKFLGEWEATRCEVGKVFRFIQSIFEVFRPLSIGIIIRTIRKPETF